MIDDLTIADPAEETQEVSGDTSFNLSEDSGDTEAAQLFCAPVLDRIRTSD
ncbi:hypothetical protein [Asticcacaulis sp.]|uniref:hypothetical protein n=1 Tax=Asticcacaulis sp. TaxID=1872648 RepID=UPI002C74D148|nr:hypothetical protein [Asticcacaulis sp.]HTM81464.1 hypothetical protein [Asticcacaulis sp.]